MKAALIATSMLMSLAGTAFAQQAQQPPLPARATAPGVPTSARKAQAR